MDLIQRLLSLEISHMILSLWLAYQREYYKTHLKIQDLQLFNAYSIQDIPCYHLSMERVLSKKHLPQELFIAASSWMVVQDGDGEGGD